MNWTLEVGVNPDAFDHKVVDAHGEEVSHVRAVKRIPMLGVIIERVAYHNGSPVLNETRDGVITRCEFVWRGKIRRRHEV